MEVIRNEKLVLASGNKGKLREMSQLLQPMGLQLRPQSDWNTPEAVENAPTFIENALIKARHASAHTGLAALADDSGLVVPALGGQPGIRSARYGADHGLQGPVDAANNALLLRHMEGLEGPERRAFFYCAMVLLRGADDPAPLVATAAWWGEVLKAPQGKDGFGYDPLFWVDQHQCSSAQLGAELKNAISHRGKAVQQLLGALRR